MKIALIPGDGVGKEVIYEGKKVLDAVADKENFEIQWNEYDFGAERYLREGKTLTEDDLKELKKYDAIYFSAIGDPRVPPGILEKGILLKLRFYFDLYVNLRPVRLFPGVNSCLKDKKPEDINFYCVRENTEDFYIGIGSAASKKHKKEFEIFRELYSIKFNLDIECDRDEIAYQIGILSKKGTERVIRYAFELAKRKNFDLVTSVDKANVLDFYSLWREKFIEISKEYKINTEFLYVDAAAMFFVMKPERFKVVVLPNLFGDILTDLGAAISGGLGFAASGNINPCGISMFEPIHGSAPDIAGKGIANPIAQILAGAMMLDELKKPKAAEMIIKAVEIVLKEGKVRTPDMNGNSKTKDVGDEIVRKIREM
ncbi:MAG: isocitrate/isopropylmalate dehydrogenase family protein [Candidatus Altarchaeaceae archaeon]